MGKRMDIVRRVNLLDGVLSDISVIRSEISCHRLALPEILKHTKGKLFASCQNELENGFANVWTNIIRSCAYINDEEKAALMTLSVLGTTCAAEQLRMLDSAYEQITSARSNAKRELTEKGRMLFSCSLLAGALAAIIII